MKTLPAILLLALCLLACAPDRATNTSDDAGLPPDAMPFDGGAASEGPHPDITLATTHAKQVTNLVKPLLDGAWTVGLVVGLVSAGGVEIYSFGRTRKGGPMPDADTLFEIGSVTKTFTSLLLADMVRRGSVTLDQAVGSLLPAGKVKVPSYAGQQISLLHLSTHTSALPRMPSNYTAADPLNPFSDYTTKLLYGFLNGYVLTASPGSRQEYSNLGAGLLGHALSLSAGKGYEALLTGRIAGPLKLRDTVITFSTAQAKRAAQGYNYDLDTIPNIDLNVLSPAGALRSTARDMLTYLSAQAGLAASPLAAAMTETHKVHYSGKMTMGLGWIHDSQGRLWHNGATGGFETFAGFDRSAKLGVIVLANAHTAWSPATLLGWRLLAMMAGQLPGTVAIPPTVPLPGASLAAFTGVYAAGNTSVEVKLGKAGLYFFIKGQPGYRMYASAPAVFYLRAGKATMGFRKDDKGIYSVMDYQSPSSGKITFMRQ